MPKQLPLLLLLLLALAPAAQAQSGFQPVILTQPQSATVSQGQAVNLDVVVGGGTPLFYQWYFDGVSIAGQNETNLPITGATVSATGYYYVAVTNVYGSVTSSPAFLAVDGPPVITTPPTNSSIFAGGSTTFSAVVGGVGPLNFQWLFNSNNLPSVMNIITTVAGNGSGGYSGNDGVSTNASLNNPAGVAVDAHGNVFFSDEYNNVIREVQCYDIYGNYGIITTVAGSGNGGYSGDGGTATNASLSSPTGVAVDAYGNLFIADEGNNVIRELWTNGIITTVAGNGSRGYSGDGGTATNANLAIPTGVAVDTYGNLFIADQGNNRIREVSTNGLITTVAGTADGYWGGYFGDGGAATNAGLSSPYGVAVDMNGNLFFSDTGNNVIREVNTNGIIMTVVGTGRYGPINNGGAATNSTLTYPYGVAMDAHRNLFIADRGNNLIEEVNASGIIRAVAGMGNGEGGEVGSYSGDGGPATSANLYFPTDVAVDAHGNLFIADQVNNVIRGVVASAGYPTLTLSNVTPNNAGSYQIIITNAFGSVTSSVVTLTVYSPLISIVPNADGSMTINLLTAPNVSSRVWAATNLTPPVVWQSVYRSVSGANGALQFIDTNTRWNPVRFYRCSTP
jgi:hypothetical protein